MVELTARGKHSLFTSSSAVRRGSNQRSLDYKPDLGEANDKGPKNNSRSYETGSKRTLNAFRFFSGAISSILTSDKKPSYKRSKISKKIINRLIKKFQIGLHLIKTNLFPDSFDFGENSVDSENQARYEKALRVKKRNRLTGEAGESLVKIILKRLGWRSTKRASIASDRQGVDLRVKMHGNDREPINVNLQVKTSKNPNQSLHQRQLSTSQYKQSKQGEPYSFAVVNGLNPESTSSDTLANLVFLGPKDMQYHGSKFMINTTRKPDYAFSFVSQSDEIFSRLRQVHSRLNYHIQRISGKAENRVTGRDLDLQSKQEKALALSMNATEIVESYLKDQGIKVLKINKQPASSTKPYSIVFKDKDGVLVFAEIKAGMRSTSPKGYGIQTVYKDLTQVSKETIAAAQKSNKKPKKQPSAKRDKIQFTRSSKQLKADKAFLEEYKDRQIISDDGSVIRFEDKAIRHELWKLYICPLTENKVTVFRYDLDRDVDLESGREIGPMGKAVYEYRACLTPQSNLPLVNIARNGLMRFFSASIDNGNKKLKELSAKAWKKLFRTTVLGRPSTKIAKSAAA